MRSSSFFSQLCQIALHGLCIFTFVVLSVPLAANEPFLNKPSNEWTEAEALQVLNDSPWAHTITTITQETPCDHEHPAFPGLFREEMAQIADLRSTQFPAESVKSEGAEYVVRLVSVKPMQAAVERLISLDEKWDPYRQGISLEPGSKPTNREESWYNPADEIIVAASLKRPGPAGASFLAYAFENSADGTAFIAHYLFACAGVRTSNGQIHAVTNRIREGKDNKASAIIMSFPGIVNGKPLISHRDEKLEFRFILNQSVFETTFIVNSTDLFDGTETVMHAPTRVDEPTPAALP
jgi:hypothetical protein